jgi:hypothetical protein
MLIATTVSFSGCIEPDEEIDQVSAEDLLFFNVPIIIGSEMAQSFIPTLNRLSRVEIKIYYEGNPGSLNMSIRKNLYGEDLAFYYRLSGQFPPGERWLEFDFEDIEVTPGETYYIVCSSESGVLDDQFEWQGSDNNPYSEGSAWQFYSLTKSWGERTDDDFCFKTYGYDALFPFAKNKDVNNIISRYLEHNPNLLKYLPIIRIIIQHVLKI